MILAAEERELLRREVDRRKRARLGERPGIEDWLTLPEASGILGVKVQRLRERVRNQRIETVKVANKRMIRVEALDLLRGEDE